MSTEVTNDNTTNDRDGRDSWGKFQPGNQLSRGNAGGNPNVRKMAEYKKALIACGSEEDIQKLYGALLAAALTGDTPAAKLLLDHLVGRPTQPIEVTGTGPAPIQTDVTAIVNIISQETPDPDMRLRIARRILQLGQKGEGTDGPIHGNGPTA